MLWTRLILTRSRRYRATNQKNRPFGLQTKRTVPLVLRVWFVGFVRLAYMVSSLISAFVKEGISW